MAYNIQYDTMHYKIPHIFMLVYWAWSALPSDRMGIPAALCQAAFTPGAHQGRSGIEAEVRWAYTCEPGVRISWGFTNLQRILDYRNGIYFELLIYKYLWRNLHNESEWDIPYDIPTESQVG
jgi:hypothetical protein